VNTGHSGLVMVATQDPHLLNPSQKGYFSGQLLISRTLVS
jgi:hypothetical protein